MGEDSHSPGLLEPGTLVDNFKILRLVGQGGMGEVYLARDVKLGRKVALKRIHPDVFGSREVIDRFLHEARVTARFNHPHIVTIYAADETPQGPYVALEFLEGQDLRTRMSGDRPGLRESVRLGLAIAEALKEAHAHQILHRDLKPENVMIPRDGRLRVLDFGLAKIIPDVSIGLDKTAASETSALEQSTIAKLFKTNGDRLMGTPLYMAPEQWQNKSFGSSADIWALGMILYELIVGQHPYLESSFHHLIAQVCGPDPVPSADRGRDVPAELAGLIDRCLSKQPENRPPAAEIVEKLDAWLSGGGKAQASEGMSPFRGLLSFSEDSAEFFFGRDAEIETFMERMREEGVLPVVGPSGAGKSSFVRAGIIPRLREQGHWQVLTMRPGSRPFRALASRLLSGRLEDVSGDDGAGVKNNFPPESRTGLQDGADGMAQDLLEAPERLSLLLAELAEKQQCRVLLFVDQAEELYTLVQDEHVRRSFMRAVCTATDDPQGPLRVIFTLRDDFLGRMAEGAEVRDALGRVTVLRTPGPEELKQILIKPLQRLGYGYDDPMLVDEMIASLHGEQAALALLQFACQMLWDGRDRDKRLLLRSVYEGMGGIAGALARHTDTVFGGFSAGQMKLSREIFLRLVTPERTRRVVARSRLLEGLGPEAVDVLERLTKSRVVLVRKGRGSDDSAAELELVHESLIHNWGQLSRWIDESREEHAFMDQITQAAELWNRRGRPDNEVWQADTLRDARRRLGRMAGPVPEKVQSFVQAGENRERRAARQRRWLKALAASLLAGAAVIAVIIAVVIAGKEREARFRLAEAQREGAKSAMAEGELLEARARLRVSLEIEDSAESRALWWRLKSRPLIYKKSFGARIFGAAFSPDGSSIAATTGTSLSIIDKTTGKISTLRLDSWACCDIAYSPDGKTIATASVGVEDFDVLLVDVEQGSVRKFKGHTTVVLNVSFSPDGKLLASCSNDRTIRVWDVSTGKTRAVLKGHTDRVRSVQFSPDGKLLASGSNDLAIRIWDVEKGVAKHVLKGHTKPVDGLSFSPDGKLLASAGRDNMIRLWDMKTHVAAVLRGHEGPVRDVAFSPDGKMLASGSDDKTVRLWDPSTGRIENIFEGHTDIVWNVGFSPDSRLLASGSWDRTLRLWNVGVKQYHEPIPGHSVSSNSASFSPDGKLLATGSEDDNMILIWDVSTGAVLNVLGKHKGKLITVTFSPDGTLLAAGGSAIELWDMATAEVRRVLGEESDKVNDIDFSPDGKFLASVNYKAESRVQLWDVASGSLVQTLSGDPGPPFISIRFSPDGRLLASGSHDGSIHIWDAASGALIKVFSGHNEDVRPVFSPDGRSIYSTGWDGTIRQWDVETGKGEILKKLDEILGPVNANPDGNRIGFISFSGPARICHVTGGDCIELEVHQHSFNDIVFKHDGSLAATAGSDGTVRLWEADTGNPVWRAPLLAHDPPGIFTHLGWIRLDEPDADNKPGKASWREAVASRACHASLSPDGKSLCLRSHDDRLELWDIPLDKRILKKPLPGVEDILAMSSGCVTLADGKAQVHKKNGDVKTFHEKASGLDFMDGSILVAADRKVYMHDLDGSGKDEYEAGAGVTAMLLTEEFLVLGYSEGNIEMVPLKPGKPNLKPSLEDVPSSPVERILPGPMNTLIIGYADGALGIWSIEDGARLHHTRLHGPVVHLLLKNKKLYAASELGDYRVLDLGFLYQDYCEILNEVWEDVKVVWEGRKPKIQDPPRNHKCSKK